jgi:thiosulfate/3-mercaptopyruvate sulfurtransferase
MADYISPIIQASELLKIYLNENLVLVDVSSGKEAKIRYEKKHLEGAIHIDLNTQLADIKEDFSNGGRHPLPGVKQFSKTLRGLGISAGSHLVLYDDKGGANAAARLWWMLRSAGHKKVQVLNGGFQAAEKIGFPINSKVKNLDPKEDYEIERWILLRADMSEVERFSNSEDKLVIDVRDAERFNGEIEPIDLIAGHIPGAINIPFSENLDADGLFLPAEKLKEKYRQVFGKIQSENIIVHCGSGVTACHTLLAIACAGLEIPRLYVGSWSEWSRNKRPMKTK